MKRVIAAAILAVLAILALAGGLAHAHEHRVGDLRVIHPYAPPTLAGVKTGAAYIAALANRGQTPDKLLRARSPIAERVEMHAMSVDAGGVMRMREAAAIPLDPGADIRMAPGQGFHFMLAGLKRPLKTGDQFPMTLEFERVGKVDILVWVEPAPGAAHTDHSQHRH